MWEELFISVASLMDSTLLIILRFFSGLCHEKRLFMLPMA